MYLGNTKIAPKKWLTGKLYPIEVFPTNLPTGKSPQENVSMENCSDKTYLFIYLFIYLFVYLSIHLFIYLFIHLFIYLFIYLSICLFEIFWSG